MLQVTPHLTQGVGMDNAKITPLCVHHVGLGVVPPSLLSLRELIAMAG